MRVGSVHRKVSFTSIEKLITFDGRKCDSDSISRVDLPESFGEVSWIETFPHEKRSFVTFAVTSKRWKLRANFVFGKLKLEPPNLRISPYLMTLSRPPSSEKLAFQLEPNFSVINIRQFPRSTQINLSALEEEEFLIRRSEKMMYDARRSISRWEIVPPSCRKLGSFHCAFYDGKYDNMRPYHIFSPSDRTKIRINSMNEHFSSARSTYFPLEW